MFGPQLFIFTIITATCSTGATVIEVAAESGVLQQRLCSNSSPGDLSSTTLLLGPGSHTFLGNTSCIVSDVEDLAILGEGAQTRIVCADDLIGSNLIFLNVTNLTIGGVSVENCGRVLPPDLPSYVNNTIFFFDPEQKVAIVFAHVTDLLLLDMHVTRSFGFGIIGINLRGDTELHNVNITDTDNYRHPLCSRSEMGLGCSGSGAVFLYSDLNAEDQLEFPPGPTNLMFRNCSTAFFYLPLDLTGSSLQGPQAWGST